MKKDFGEERIMFCSSFTQVEKKDNSATMLDSFYWYYTRSVIALVE